MVAFVIAIILLIISIIGFFIWRSGAKGYAVGEAAGVRDRDLEGEQIKKAVGLGGFIIAGALGLLFLVISTVAIVQPGHVQVVTFGGEIKGTLDAGWNWIPPWHDTTDYSIQFETFTAANGNDEGDDDSDTNAIQAPTKDGSLSDVELTVRYALDPTASERMLEQYGGDYVNRIVFPDVRATVRDIFVRYDALDGRENREALGAELTETLEAEWKGLFILDSAQIRKVILAPSVQERADAVLEAEQKAREREFDLETSRVDAEIARTQAEAVRDSQQIIICGAAEEVQEDGTTVLIPNEEGDCQEQLSPELLSWKCLETVENNNTTVLWLDCGLSETGSGVNPDVIVNAPESTP